MPKMDRPPIRRLVVQTKISGLIVEDGIAPQAFHQVKVARRAGRNDGQAGGLGKLDAGHAYRGVLALDEKKRTEDKKYSLFAGTRYIKLQICIHEMTT